MNTALIMPIFSLMGVTASVWLVMYYKRISYLKKNNIDPQKLSTRQAKLEMNIPDYVSNTADNFNNLLELPIIFYVTCMLASLNNLTSPWLIVLAWGYVSLRIMHSVIQCTYNRVMHRFAAYFLSSIFLWVLVAMSALGVLAI